MRRELFLVIAVLTLHRQGLSAQSSVPSSCSFDTAARLGFDTVLIALGSGSRIGNKPELRNDYLAAAQTILEHYRAPERIWVPLWARLVSDTNPPGRETTDDARHGFDGEVRFRLDSTGRLATDSIAVETLNDDLALSVAAAIRRADSAAAFGPPSKKLLKDRGIIRLHFVNPRRTTGRAATLLRVIVPTVRLDKRPSMQSRPRMRYPEDLRASRISGRVLLQFVIDADGRPVQSTLSVVRGEYRSFIMTAVDAVPEMRFTPGRVADCDLPVLVRVPFEFNIRN
jgi:TonB family protein